VAAKEYTHRGQSVLNLIENCGKRHCLHQMASRWAAGVRFAMRAPYGWPVRWKFGQPKVETGIIPGYGGTQRFAALGRQGRAMQLVLAGEMISAQEGPFGSAGE